MAITPTKIILKHSFNTGAEPDVNSLVNGEIAFNAVDSTLFWKGKSGDLVTKNLNITDDVSAVIADEYSDFLISDINLVADDLVVTYYGENEKNLGNVRGATGVGISPVFVYDYADELPNGLSDPPLAANLQKTGVTCAVLLGAVTGDTPWANTHIYVFKADDITGGSWTDLGELIGATGPQGLVGDTGPNGTDGIQGAIGATGVAGPVSPPATDITLGLVEFATEEEVFDANSTANNTVVRAKHLSIKKDTTTAAVNIGDFTEGGNGKIRIHPDGQVGFTLKNSATAPDAGTEGTGDSVTNILPDGYAALRRDAADIFVDYNEAGSITTKPIGVDQQLSISGTTIILSDGGQVELPVPVIGNLQSLSLDNGDITITGGNTITLPTVEDATQTLSILDDQLTIENGNTIALPVNTAQGVKADSALQAASLDSLEKLNGLVLDATLIDTEDSRLNDQRTPLNHSHPLTDLDISGTIDGQVVAYNETAGAWEASTLTYAIGDVVSSNNLSDLTDPAAARVNLGLDDNTGDVTLAGDGTYLSIANQVLTVNNITESDIDDLGAYIVNINGESISSLSDVNITSPVTSDLVQWNGSTWVNKTIAGAGLLNTLTYDPNNKNGNAFDMDKMDEGATNLILTGSERDSIAGIGTVQGTDFNYDIKAVSSLDTVPTDPRGEGSVDLQTNRDLATQVASGSRSVLIGGINNTASGVQSAVIGGSNHTAGVNNSAIVGGTTNTIEGTSAVGFIGGGNDNTISDGNYGAIIGGNGHNLSGTNSVILGGRFSNVTAPDTIVAGDTATATHNGARVFANSVDVEFASIANQEFAIEASALRLVDTNEGTGKVLTSDVNGSGNWKQPTVFDVRDYGAVPDGSVDSRQELQDTIDAAEATMPGLASVNDVGQAHVVVDLAGGVYGINDTVVISKTIKLQNGAIKALQVMDGATSVAANASSFLLEISANADRTILDGVDFDGGLNGTTRYANLIYNDAGRTSISNCMGIYFPDYGIWHAASSNNSLSKYTNVFLQEWAWGDAGRTDDALRTAAGFFIENTASNFTDCSVHYTKYPFHITGEYHTFTGCMAECGINDNGTTTYQNVSVLLEESANGKFNNCTFRNGSVTLRSASEWGFKNIISGCIFETFYDHSSDYPLVIDSTTLVGTNVEGLIVTGCLFTDTSDFWVDYINFASLTAPQTGTFVSELYYDMQWVGNSLLLKCPPKCFYINFVILD